VNQTLLLATTIRARILRFPFNIFRKKTQLPAIFYSGFLSFQGFRGQFTKPGLIIPAELPHMPESPTAGPIEYGADRRFLPQ
jgi:hypothetical protein